MRSSMWRVSLYVAVIVCSARLFAQTCPTAGPILSGPTNGATNVPTTITFSWSAVPNATQYDIRYGKVGEGACSGAGTVATSNTTSFNPPPLEAGQTYSWMVFAKNGACDPRPSSCATFQTAGTSCPTTGATPFTPSAGANFNAPTPSGAPITFSWSSVANATGYDVLLKENADPAVRIISSTTGPNNTSTVVSIPAGNYVWAVRTKFGTCASIDSTAVPFTVAAPQCPTGVAALLKPGNNSTGLENPVTFEWGTVADARAYRLMVSVDGAAFQAISVTSNRTFTTTIPGTAVEWFVQTIFDNCPTTDSTHFKFAMKAAGNCPANPERPALTSPAEGATGLSSPVTFAWTGVANAKTYRVIVIGSDNKAFTAGETTATSLTAPMPAGTFSWTVEARFGDEADGCASTFAARRTFTVSTGASCNNSGVTLVSPANQAQNVGSPVTLRWNAVPGAVSYRVFASLNGGDFTLIGVVEREQLERVLPAGATIRWNVVAVFAGCPDVTSPTFEFTVDDPKDCPTGTITLAAPANGSTVSSPVTFAWSALAGAIEYRVVVAIDGDPPAVVAKTTGTTATVQLPSGVANWAVEAVLPNNCPPIVSQRASFTIQQSTSCANNAPPTLVSPIGGATSSSPVELRWNGVAGAVAYRVWAARAGQPFGDIGLTTNTTLTRKLEDGVYAWFVEAIFGGCPTVESSRAAFRVESAGACGGVATPITPADNAVETTPVTFAWSEVPNADEYRLFGSINDGPFGLIGVTDATTFTRFVPPGKITWYVQTTFEGCASTESAKRVFNVAQAQNCGSESLQLVSPANGATNVSSPVTFAWSPLNRAVSYIVWAKTEQGVAAPIAQTGATSLTRLIPPGLLEWWVVGVIAGCPPVESAHFQLTVAVTAECDTKKPVLLVPHDGANDVPAQVHFAWTPVPRATGYRLWVAQGDQGEPTLLASTTAAHALVNNVPTGPIRWYVEATFANCPPSESATGKFEVVAAPPCGTPDQPRAYVPGQVLSGTQYNVRWTPVPNAGVYELQESATADFANATTQAIAGAGASFTHTATDAPVQYFYRVRAVSSCNDDRGPYSDVVSVFVMPPKPPSKQQHVSAELGLQGTVVQTLVLPGSDPPVQFTAAVDKPWLTVTPSSGTLGPNGVTLTVASDPDFLFLGTNTGTVTVSYSPAGKGAIDDATPVTPTTVPISVSLVTPVSSTGKSTPPPDSLIIPAVAHAAGVGGSLFESDVRVANLGSQTMKYQLNFTPSGTDGTQTGSSSTIEISPGASLALDDILANFFGSGTTSSSSGTLEIRPITTTSATTFGSATSTSLASPRTTVASSRTYNFTENGTFGQHIPAVPFSQFIGKSSTSIKTLLSLQQIQQSSAQRMNFGLVEGSGEPASVLLHVFDNFNLKVAEIPVSLLAGEHKQINSLLAVNGITLSDGRIEVEVTSDTGRVTAYASQVDNATNDPLLVSPVLKTSITGTRYILPGVADLNNGIASWRTDMRVFNAGSAAQTATLTYYPQSNPGGAVSKEIEIAAGQVLAIDNTLQSLFNLTNSGGMAVITTPSASSLVVTGRTYNQTSTGTYGQFIPGITPETSVGLGGPTLQILQAEQSTRIRTNVGIGETTGNEVTVEVSVIIPDSRVTPKIPITLRPNEFVQLSLGDLGIGNAVYNARVSVKVVGGTGKVTAYGSAIDQITQDPTYIQAQ